MGREDRYVEIKRNGKKEKWPWSKHLWIKDGLSGRESPDFYDRLGEAIDRIMFNPRLVSILMEISKYA